jgi:protein-disulfide isomerase
MIRSSRVTGAVLVATLTVLTAGSGARAQAVGQDQQVLDELRKIRQLLQLIEQMIAQQNVPRQVPAPVEPKIQLSSLTGFSLGKSEAPLTMIEFTDLQCPFCGQYHATVFNQIRNDYVETGKLRYISRDFPLEAIHPLAVRGARAARCAAAEGKFWEMRHAILANHAHLGNDSFGTFAQDLGLDLKTFTTCTADGTRFRAEIQNDIADGTAAGVDGTPSFVIGRSSASGLVDGVRVAGAQPYSVFEAKFKELLTAKPATNP